MECLRKYHRNPQHETVFLAVLFNAPTTISNHYTVQVNHDMYAGGLVNSRFSVARQYREKGFCHETTSCLHYGSLEQQPV